MSSYNQLNGTYCGDSRELLTDILRDEWGFEGFVISDWIFGLRDAAVSVHAGLDIEMPYRMVRAAHLADALDTGEASSDDVDLAVTRIVATLLRFDDVLAAEPPARSTIGAPEHVALAREAAARSVVLLRNESVGVPMLPLDRNRLPEIAVVGPLADHRDLGEGGSSDVYSLDNVTVLDGIRAAAPAIAVSFADGCDVAAAVALAETADTRPQPGRNRAGPTPPTRPPQTPVGDFVAAEATESVGPAVTYCPLGFCGSRSFV